MLYPLLPVLPVGLLSSLHRALIFRNVRWKANESELSEPVKVHVKKQDPSSLAASIFMDSLSSSNNIQITIIPVMISYVLIFSRFDFCNPGLSRISKWSLTPNSKFKVQQ
ncbi:hypothetical protein D4764_14G0007020 [Takifugu flavidus]|uniref:Uncharacterized protein n=1 Tax=Takifugu flavidus TaxID=433684 RepID=A0A5C6P6X3_9TELE|nr:hypothetical protein D4764_14G0007020 [Takifugu flavidus]